MKYKAIIFDMDGTIVDTEKIWEDAGHELIKRHNIHLSDDQKRELQTLLHGGAVTYSCSIIKEFTQLPEPVEILVQEKLAIVQSLYANGIKFIEGFLAFHKAAQHKNLKMAIATNATADFVSITDQVLNLSKLFGKHLYHIAHVNNKAKPAPDLYLYAANQLEIDPTLCIAIEDSAHGVHAAKTAGMYTIGINTNKTPAMLRHAHKVVDYFHEIVLEEL